MIIECTKKLADAMKIKISSYNAANADSFYEWHANLFMFDRRKGILLMNNKTRYCIVLYGVKMEHFKKFDKIVLDAIRETFLADGFPEDTADKYITKCRDVDYTKTHDRSVLGQMKDFDISISWKIEEYLPSENINLIELNKWVNNTLMCGSLNYAHPIDLMREELEGID
ncbi:MULTISPECIES: hypothetical protein [Clostridium]|uniref:DUF6933 domain-containing protein n=1 Tax=Clostridium TaxID=1485 RepID=UPI0006996B6E|nr:hypothetical protein [Clostridium sp. C8]